MPQTYVLASAGCTRLQDGWFAVPDDFANQKKTVALVAFGQGADTLRAFTGNGDGDGSGASGPHFWESVAADGFSCAACAAHDPTALRGKGRGQPIAVYPAAGDCGEARVAGAESLYVVGRSPTCCDPRAGSPLPLPGVGCCAFAACRMLVRC